MNSFRPAASEGIEPCGVCAEQLEGAEQQPKELALLLAA
jgi:hypothetical protein